MTGAEKRRRETADTVEVSPSRPVVRRTRRSASEHTRPSQEEIEAHRASQPASHGRSGFAPAYRPRARRIVLLSVLAALVVAAVGGAVVYQRTTKRNAAIDRAVGILETPFVRSPEIDRVDFLSAIEALEEADRLSLSSDPNALGLLAEARAISDLARGDLILAEGEITSARLRLGQTPRVRVLSGLLARRKGDLELAEAQAQEALRLEPDNERAKLLLADVALDREDGTAAARALEPLIAAHPELSALQNRRALLIELEGDAPTAIATLREAARLDPGDPTPLLNLGRILASTGRPEEAIAAYDRALALSSADPIALLGRALARIDADDLDGAKVDLDRVIELEPHSIEARIALGDLERRRGHAAAAIASYRAALVEDDGLPLAWLKLGNVLVEQREHQAAITAFDRAIALDPSISAAHNGRGVASLALGHTGEANDALVRAANLDDDDPNPWRNLALVFEQTGDADAAAAARDEADKRSVVVAVN